MYSDTNYEILLEEHRTAFDHSLWSRFYWLEILSWSKLLRKAHALHLKEHNYSAIQDAYYALQTEAPNASPAGLAWQKVIDSPVFPKLSNLAEQSKTGEVNVMLFLARKFYEMLNQKEDQEKKKDKQNPQKGSQPNNKPGEITQEITQEDIEQALNELGSGGDEGEQDVQADPQAGPSDMDISPDDIEKMVFAVSEKELESLEEKIDGEEALLGLMAGKGQSPIQQREWVEVAFDQYALSRMSKLIGWGENIVDGAVRQNKGAVGAHTEITQKGWNPNVTAMDMALVASGSMLGKAKFAKNSLNTKIKADEAPAGKGGVVFLHDESSSMKDELTHTFQDIPPESRTPQQQKALENNPPKDLQAINLQLAMAHLFRKENRPFTAVAWDHLRTRVCKYGKDDVNSHLKQFLSGGTEVTHALLKAFEIIKSDPQHCNNSDIIIATDGETDDNPNDDSEYVKQVEEYRKKGGRIWGIYIGGYSEYTMDKMKEYCDAVISIKDLYTNEGIAQILRSAATSTHEHKKKLI